MLPNFKERDSKNDKRRGHKTIRKLTGGIGWLIKNRLLRSILAITLIICIVIQTVPASPLVSLAETIVESVTEAASETTVESIAQTVSETVASTVESIAESLDSLGKTTTEAESETEKPSESQTEQSTETNESQTAPSEPQESTSASLSSPSETEKPSDAETPNQTDPVSTSSEAGKAEPDAGKDSTPSEADPYVECTCGALPNESGYTIHDPDCPLYDPDKLPECTCGALINDTGITIHEPYCPLYQPERPECICGAQPDENGFTFHEPDCPMYQPPWDGTADVTWYEEAGKEASEYRISTAGQLAGFAQLVLGGETFKDKTVILKNDLNLEGAEWIPIGSWDSAAQNLPFEGRFIGGGHILLNLNINQPDADGLGLFGYNAGEIRGVVLKNVNLQGADRVGGIAAVNGGEITDCTVEGSVAGKTRFGDLVGLDLKARPDYSKLKDVKSVLKERGEELTEEEMKQLKPPLITGFDVEREEGGLLLTAKISELQDQTLQEYGFVWSLEGEEPTLLEHSGIYSSPDGEGYEEFSYTLPETDNALVRAYAVYGEYVVYTGALDADNLVEGNAVRPMVYRSAGRASTKGETYVYGKGGNFDKPFVSLFRPAPVRQFDIVVDREVDPNETIYIAVKGSFGAITDCSLNGRLLQSLSSTMNEEYFVCSIQGRDLALGVNTFEAETWVGWFYIDNIQLIFGGGPGEYYGKKAEITDLKLRGYNFTKKVIGYKCTVDGTLNVENETGRLSNILTSLSLDGYRMMSSQKWYLKLPNKTTINTVNKCTDEFLAYNQGTLSLTALLLFTPPPGSDWAAQDEDAVIISLKEDTVGYTNKEGPNEFRLNFDYDKNYYSTEKKPLHISWNAESVFGEPFSYVCLPSAGEVERNKLEKDPDEGVNKKYGRLKNSRPVPVDFNNRVYASEGGFDITTNGAYEFAVVGPSGTEKFVLKVINIDNKAPDIELVGASEITILEDTPYSDIGFGAVDNNTLEKKLILNTDPGGMDFEHPEGGRDYEVRCTATDQAGNVGVGIRTIHVKSRPLELTTQPVEKSASGVKMKGNIRYMGDEPVVERGLVWDLGSAPTKETNMGKYSAAYQVDNRDTFSTVESYSSLIPNAVYYYRAYATTYNGKTVYGPAQSFEASDKNYGQIALYKTALTTRPGASITLTVTRKGGTDGKQTVRWRTVDGSAISGYHYRSTGGVITFEQGQSRKYITINMLPSPKGLYHWELQNRVFFIELYGVSGGASLDTEQSTCRVTIDDNDNRLYNPNGIMVTGFDQWEIVSRDQPVAYKRFGGAAFGRKNNYYYPSESGFDLSAYKYWGEHGRVQGKQNLIINMRSADSGLYVYARKNGEGWSERASHYYNKGNGEKLVETGVMDLTGQDYVMAKGLSVVRVKWSWVEFKNPRLSLRFMDTDTPRVRQITALSGDYKADDAIYFAARFNEIVTVSDEEKLYMNIGLQTGGTQKALYVAGTGTDTLVFRMKVPENSVSAGVTAELVGEETYVKDLANHPSAAFSSANLRGVNINSMPYLINISPESGGNANRHDITINVEKPDAYKGQGETYQYAFSNSEFLDQTAMKQLKPFASSQTVSLDGGSGDFWLHVVIRDNLGVYRTSRGPYTINNGIPSFRVTAGSTEWTREQVRLKVTMDDERYMDEGKSQLTIQYVPDPGGTINEENYPPSAPTMNLDQVENGSYYVDITDNGSYVFLAKDALSGKRYLSTAAVTCIDRTPPKADIYRSMADRNMDDYSYTSDDPTVYGYMEDGESGIASGGYLFSRGQTAPVSGWKPFESGDSLKFSEYFKDSVQEAGQWYLHLRVRDQAGNETILSHPNAFTVPPKDPPLVSVEVEPLPEGRNDFGSVEGAFSPEELTRQSPLPDRMTARIVWLHVTAKKSDMPGAADLNSVMLPESKAIYDNNNRPEDHAAPVYASAYLVEDINPEPGIIEFRYPVEENGVYRFVAGDKNNNSSDLKKGTVIVTAVDREPPEIDYTKTDQDGRNLYPGDWVNENGGVTLTLSFNDLVSPVYGEGDTFLDFVGSKNMEYQILQGNESENGKPWISCTKDSTVSYTVHENDAFLVKVRDEIGNTYTQKISVTNIDSTPPYVDTTNTSYGVGKAPITMQLKYADKEMGLVKVRRFAVANSTEEPAAWENYDGSVLSIKDPGTWYVHYFAADDVGHETKGYFGPYIIDDGKPSIMIDSPTSDEYMETDGVVTIYQDDKYARMHSAQVTIQYPLSVAEDDVTTQTREYQWSQKTSPSLFGWKDAPVANCQGRTAKFTLDSWGSEGTSGRWYLHIRTKGTASYRGFLFDNDLPVITVIGDNPLYIARGEDYIDRGATAVDSQDGTAAVTTKVQDGAEVVDTRYILTDKPGEHVVTYTATDRSGNTSTAQRIVYVFDNVPPAAESFALETDEDVRLNLTRKDFEDHYEDDGTKPVLQADGTYITVSSLTRVHIQSLPSHGVLRLYGAAVAEGQEIGAERLDGLTYDPDENYYGDDVFSYTVFDDGAGIREGNESEKADLTIRVASVNDTPTAENTTVYTDEEAPVTADVEKLIGDVEDGTNLTVTTGDITVLHGAASNVIATGTALVEGRRITYTPAVDFNGLVSIPYTVTDSQGLTATAVLKVIVNNVNDAPVVSENLSISEGADDDGLYRGGQEVDVTWKPAVDADNDPVTYTITMVDETRNQVTAIGSKLEGSSYSWTLPNINGPVRLQLTASDGLTDSKDTLVSRTVVIDSVKPVVNAVHPEEKDWCRDESVAVTAEASDEGQPDKTVRIEYAADCAPDGVNYSEGPWSETGIAKGEGLNRVRVRAIDAAGNISETVKSPVYRLDRTEPSEFSLTSVLDPVENGVTGVTVSGTAADDQTSGQAVSGLAENPYSYSMDGGEYTAYDQEGSRHYGELAPNTQHSFTFQAVDKAGNIRESQVLKCYTRAQDAVSADLTDWNSEKMTVTFTAPANPAGTEYQAWLVEQYKTEKTAVSAYSTDMTRTFQGLKENTVYHLYIQSRNFDGVESEPVVFKTDSTGEAFKTNRKPVLKLDDQEKLRYYRSGDTITLTGTVEDSDCTYHGSSDLPEVKVEFGGVTVPAALAEARSLFGLLPADGKWIWTAVFTVDGNLADVPDGKYQPVVSAADNRKDTAESSYSGIWLDRKVPREPRVTDMTDQDNASDPLIYSSEKAIWLTLEEQGDTPTGTTGNENPSGFSALRYKLEGDPDSPGGGQNTNEEFLACESGGKVEISNEGHTTITIEAEDRAGNTVQITRDIYIDRTAPEAVKATATVNGQPYSGNWVNQDIAVELNAADSVGVKKIYARVTDSQAMDQAEDPNTYDRALTEEYSKNALETSVLKTITLTAQQQNYIHYLIVDTAGNQKTFTSGPYKLDKTAPAPVYQVPEKELASAGNESVILRGHSASVTAYDEGNTGSNTSADHVAGLSKAEFVWLPSRIGVNTADGSFTVTESGASVPTDDGGNQDDSGIDAYSWQEFTNGAQLIQGGKIDGTWHLWVRLTDGAGNIAFYNESVTGVHTGQKFYPAFRFDNEAPNLPEKDGNSVAAPGTVVNHKTYGTLDVSLPVDDKNYDNTNSGPDEYQYVFTTDTAAPSKDGLPVFRFENKEEFLEFDGSVTVTADTAVDDIKASRGLTYAAELRAAPDSDKDQSLLKLNGSGGTVFEISISPVTGALVLTDSSGDDKYFGGNFNDGRVHKIVVAASFDSAVKVFADGNYMGRFWFPVIDKAQITGVSMGEGLTGRIFGASLFGRVADDSEGRSFVFRTDDIVGDYLFCTGIDGNVNGSAVTDRSGQDNTAEVTVGASWNGEYKSTAFLQLSEGVTNPIINLDRYLEEFKKADALTISTTFKSTAAKEGITHPDTGWGERLYNTVFSANMGMYDTLYIAPYKSSTDPADAGLAIVTGSQTTGTGSDWANNKILLTDLKGLDLCDGKAHTVTVTFRDTKMMVYADNMLRTTADIPREWMNQVRRKADCLRAGGIQDENMFKGVLYNTHMFARALTREEIESGNINYTDRPIALLNFTEADSADQYDSVVQTGAGIRFDDSGDYLDIGKTLGIINPDQVNADGFSASVRFRADRVKKTGKEYANSDWGGPDPAVGQRALTLKKDNDVASLFAMGIDGSGEENVFVYWRDQSDYQQTLSAPVPGLTEGEHYMTVSYTPSGTGGGKLTIFVDGKEAASRTVSGLYRTPTPTAQALIGSYIPAGTRNGIYPEGAGQFYGTIYNVNLRMGPISLTDHIKEARNHVMENIGTPLAAYNLDEASGGTVPNLVTGNTVPAAVIHGIGDAGLKLDGKTYMDFHAGISGYDMPVTYEVVVSADDIQNGVVFAQAIDQYVAESNQNLTHAAITYRRDMGGYRSEFYPFDTPGNTGPVYPAAPGDKVRLTFSKATFNEDMEHIKVYADGHLIGTTNGSFGPYLDNFRIGNGFDTNLDGTYFKGTVYDVKVWNKALTPGQIAGTEKWDYDDLAVHYDFAGDMLADKSGHGRNGVINSGAAGTVTGLYPHFDGSSLSRSSVAGTGILSQKAYATVTIDTRFTYEGTAEGDLFNVWPQNTSYPSHSSPAWLRINRDSGGLKAQIGITTDNANNPEGAASIIELPLDDGRAVHEISGKIYRDTAKAVTSYDMRVDGKSYQDDMPGTGGASEEIIQSDGTVYIGNGGNGADFKGTIYHLSLDIGGTKLLYGPGGRQGSTSPYTWVESGGKNLTTGSGVTWVPEPGNIYGEYPEFLGNGSSYAATEEGLITLDKPFTYRMKFKPLPSASGDGLQNYVSLARDQDNESTAPFFLLTHKNVVTPMYLYTSGSGKDYHASAPLGEISSTGTYDIEFTVDKPKNTYSAVCNGTKTDGPIPINGTLYDTNGQIQLAYRNYPAQNAHMILYEFEALQDGVTVCRYDGTRSADGTRLIDVSGKGNDATINGTVNWVTGAFDSGEQVITPPTGSGWQWVADDLSQSGMTQINVSQSVVQGKVYLHMWVRDKLGNEVQRTYGPFDYDITPPQISLSARKAKGSEDATSGYLSISLSDNWSLVKEKNSRKTRWTVWETSGRVEEPVVPASAAWTEFDGVPVADTTIAASASASHELTGIGDPSAPKKYYVAVEAADWLGNTDTEFLYVDKDTLFDDSAAPVITLTPVEAAGQWSKSHSVQVDVTDSGSGVNDQTLLYAWSKEQAPPSSGWRSFFNHNTLRLEGEDGTWYLHVKGYDNAGNGAQQISAALSMDNTPPALTADRENQAYSKDYGSVKVSVTDAGGGISHVYYAPGSYGVEHFTGGTAVEGVTELSDPYGFHADSLGLYTVYACDSAGNESVVLYTEDKVDKLPPSVSLTPVSSAYTKDDITVAVSISDTGGSGLNKASYVLDGAPVQDLTLTNGKADVRITGLGDHTLEVTAWDAAGNSSKKSGTYHIDNQPPAITISQSAGTKKEHTITVTAGQTPAGACRQVRFGWGDESSSEPYFWTAAQPDGSGAFTVTRNIGTGTYKLFVEAVSATGVKAVEDSTSFTFDNTKPELETVLTPEGWTKEAVLSVNTEDGAVVTVTLDGTALTPSGEWNPAADGSGKITASYQVAKNGACRIVSTDAAGNESLSLINITTIDRTEPSLTLSPQGGAGVWYGKDVAVTASASDAESGVKEITYSLDNSGDQPSAAVGEGIHTVSARAVDYAGNTKALGAVTYQVDKTAPTLSPVIAADGITEASLTVKANASDPGSDTGTGSGIDESRTEGVLTGESGLVMNGGVFSGLEANRAYRPRITVFDKAGNQASKAMAAVYTKAALPTGLTGVKAGVDGLKAKLTPGTNSTAPRYSFRVYKSGSPDSPLYDGSASLSRSAEIDITYSTSASLDDNLILEVTAYNEDEVKNTKEFQISGGSAGELNAAPTITVAGGDDILVPGSAAAVAENISTEFTLNGTAADANTGDTVTASAAVDGVSRSAEAAGGAWSLTWNAADLREGIYENVEVTASDQMGAASAVTFAHRIIIDKTAPLPPAIEVNSGEGWQSEGRFTLAANVADSDIDHLEYRLDGESSWTVYGGSEVSLDKVSGERTVFARAVDQAGNPGAQTQRDIKIDTNRPEITADQAGGDSWLTGDQTVKLSFSDDYKLTSAGYLVSSQNTMDQEQLKKSMMKVEPGDSLKSAAADVMMASEGIWYIHALAEDHGGITVKTFGPWKIDRTVPEAPQPAIAAGPSKDGISLSGKDLTVDVLSGVDQNKTNYEFQKDGDAGFQTSADGILTGLRSNAEYRIRISAMDQAGNKAEGPELTACTLAADPAAVTLKSRGSGYFTFLVTGNASNDMLPEYRILLKDSAGNELAGSAWSPSTEIRVDLAGLGSQTVYPWIQTRSRQMIENPALALADQYGFNQAGLSGTNAPVITIDMAEQPGVLHDGDIITITGTARDADGGELYVSASIDHVEKTVKLTDVETAKPWSLTWNIREDSLCTGTYGTISGTQVTVMDPEDNQATATDPIIYHIDNAGPKAPQTRLPVPEITPGESGTYRIDLHVGEDRGEAGVAGYEYALDGNTPVKGTGSEIPSIEVTGEGRHTLTAKFTDSLGNIGDTLDLSFTIDSVAPQIISSKLYTFDESQTFGWTETSKQPSADAWYQTWLEARFAFDSGKVSYEVNNTPDRPESFGRKAEGASAAIRMEREDIFWIHLRAEDEAGNTAFADLGPYQIDREPIPAKVTAGSSLPARSHSAVAEVNIGTDRSGLDRAEYLWTTEQVYKDSLTDWKPLGTDAPETLTLDGKDGTWYLYVRVYDKAGNRTVERSDGMKCDNTAPTLTLGTAEPAGMARSKEIPVSIADESGEVYGKYLKGSHGAEDFAAVTELITHPTVTVTEEGTYTFYAADEAGNETIQEITVTGVDSGAPEITVQGPAGVWNKQAFAVDITVSDPEGHLKEIGIIDPQYYNVSYGMQNSTEAYKNLPDINDVVTPGVTGIDTSHFAVKQAADYPDGKIRVTIGSGDGDLFYNANGSIMLHLAAADEAGNVAYRTFGPYKLDNEAPYIQLDDPNENYISTSILPPSQAGQENFTGYTLKDNVTTVFYYYAPGQPVPEADGSSGSYTIHFDPGAMDQFTKEGLYQNALTFEITDAAGNQTVVTKDCRVHDTLAPMYGSNEKNGSGDSFTNYISVETAEDTAYQFRPEDFLPADGPNRLFETSLPLDHITVHALPAYGELELSGGKVTVGQKIPFSDIGTLTYTPSDDWNGSDNAMRFTACDKVGNETADVTDATSVLIGVTPVNDPPVLEDVFPTTVTIADNETYMLRFRVEDRDTLQKNITVTASTQEGGKAECTVKRQTDGSWLLTVVPEYNAATTSETITVTADDHGAENNQAVKTFLLTAKYVEKPFIARDDGAKTNSAGVVDVNVLANDIMPDPALRTVELEQSTAIIAEPSHGTAQVIDPGRPGENPVIRYTETTPGADIQDSFKYQVTVTEVFSLFSLARMPGVTGDVYEAVVYINDDTPPAIELTDGPSDKWCSADKLEFKVSDSGGLAKAVLKDPEGHTAAEADGSSKPAILTASAVLNGVYTLEAEDVNGNKSSMAVTVDHVDAIPPTVDTTKMVLEGAGLTGIRFLDEGGSGIDKAEAEPAGSADVSDNGDGTRKIVPQDLYTLDQISIKITDLAGNETTHRFTDLAAPLLEADRSSQDNSYYLPVNILFEDYLDVDKTKEGSVVEIDGCSEENITPLLPKARGSIHLTPVTAPYTSPGAKAARTAAEDVIRFNGTSYELMAAALEKAAPANSTVYNLMAVDAGGNRTPKTVIMKHIPTPDSVTPENREEIKKIIDEIKKEQDSVRPGIDIPQGDYDRITDQIKALEEAVEKNKPRENHGGDSSQSSDSGGPEDYTTGKGRPGAAGKPGEAGGPGAAGDQGAAGEPGTGQEAGLPGAGNGNLAGDGKHADGESAGDGQAADQKDGDKEYGTPSNSGSGENPAGDNALTEDGQTDQKNRGFCMIKWLTGGKIDPGCNWCWLIFLILALAAAGYVLYRRKSEKK